MAIFGFVKFWVCSKEVNVNFEPEFGNPRFETPKKLNVFNSIFNLFLSNLWILSFGSVQTTSFSWESWSLEFISWLFIFYAQQQKKGVQIQLFKTWVLTKPDFENTKKKPISNLKKAIYVLL